MKTIPLTQGMVTKVDDVNFESLNKYKWYAHKSKNTYYAQRGCKLENGKRGNIHMHQVIMNTKNRIDHEDGDGLNNLSENLREATNSQNQMNKVGWGEVKYKGVQIQRGKYFVAHIVIKGKQKHLGSFKTPIEAAKAYDKAAKFHFKQYAKLNFPEI